MIETRAVSDTSDLEQRIARQAERDQAADDASIGDVIDSVKAYAKQETIGPLRGAGSWLGFGVAAALTLGLGLFLMLLGLLRLLQTEWTRSATGSLSWLAYVVTLAVALVLLALAISRVKKATLHKEPK